jgi:hypothetical protein
MQLLNDQQQEKLEKDLLLKFEILLIEVLMLQKNKTIS